MRTPTEVRVLTINSGSSSLKIGLYEMGEAERLVLSGSMERIGLRAGLFRIEDSSGKSLIDEHIDLPDHEAALKRLFAWLEEHEAGRRLDAVGHRVVHGGPRYNRPHLITSALLAELKELVPLAPDHLPHEIKAIQATICSGGGDRQASNQGLEVAFLAVCRSVCVWPSATVRSRCGSRCVGRPACLPHAGGSSPTLG